MRVDFLSVFQAPGSTIPRQSWTRGRVEIGEALAHR